jgi:predicted phosphodiesterase
LGGDNVRLHVLSDLHLEHGSPAPGRVEADVVVLAGDIATGTGGVEWARAWAADRPLVYVSGNHELYGQALPELLEELRRAAAGSSVHVLEHEQRMIGGVRFLGCTLWSDFDYDGPARRALSMRVCERVVNDYKLITFGPQGRALTARDTRNLHLASRRWLTARLADHHDGPTVVVTHHAPLIGTRPQSPELRALAGAFASDLTELIDARQVALWIFGHTHQATDVVIAGARVLSNPYGYPHQRVAGFDPGLVIELDDPR